MSSPDDFNLELSAALDLDQDERDYLASLDLSGAWRARSSTASTIFDGRWGRLAFLGVVAAFVVWTFAGGPLGQLLVTANQLGLGTLVATSVVGLLLGFSETLIDISTNPALGLSQPLLAVLALVILVWPRITSASRTLQGVHS